MRSMGSGPAIEALRHVDVVIASQGRCLLQSGTERGYSKRSQTVDNDWDSRSAPVSRMSNMKGKVRKDIDKGIEDVQKGVRSGVKDVQKGVRSGVKDVQKGARDVGKKIDKEVKKVQKKLK